MSKILIVAENPRLDTGQSRIGRTVANALYKAGHGIVYLAWCPSQVNSDRKLPYQVIYSEKDYGQTLFDKTVMADRPDIVLTIGDPWHFDYINFCTTRGLFYYVMYTAVDGLGYSGGVPKQFEDYIGGADYVITYTAFGRRAILKTMPYLVNRIDSIYHGIDTRVYYPETEEKRKEFKVKYNTANRFMFLYSGRTHFRKNIIHVIKAYRIFLDCTNSNDAGLWLNVNFADSAGQDMNKMITEYGLQGKIFTFDSTMKSQSAVDLMPESLYNSLLNMCDCVLTVGGEGFGYLVAEAFMARTPVITLGESATGELGAFGRARLVKGDAWLTGAEMTERPFPNPKVIAKAMISAKDGNNSEYVNKAYTWATKNLSQDVIDRRWRDVLKKIEHPLDYPLVLESV